MSTRVVAKPEDFPRASLVKFATWNVYYGTPARELKSILHRLQVEGVSLLFQQEAGGADITNVVEASGYGTYVEDQYRLSWNMDEWTAKALWFKQLSDTTIVGEHGNFKVGCVMGRFWHHRTNEMLKGMSYHTPAHVQRPEWNRDAPNRFKALQESMEEMVRIARRSKIKNLCFAGDDNVDERRTPGAGENRWDFMTNTDPLTQLQAPKPTHAGGRKIDDFRYAGTTPVGRGKVWKGGGDHKIFIQQFSLKSSKGD